MSRELFVNLSVRDLEKSKQFFMVRKALEAGGRHAMDATDHGFMYSGSFYDLDGHHWEVVWMDPKTIQ